MSENLRTFPSAAINPEFGGMTLRDWFAGQALAGMASIALDADDMDMAWVVMSEAAFKAADAMLAERERGQ